MIKGIGVDICDIERIAKAIKQEGFLRRVFSEEEIEYAEKNAVPAVHYASAFAAREALAKAGGWGVGRMGLKSCSVRRSDNGPQFVFTDEFLKKLEGEKIKRVFLSLSHDGGIAAAMVVLEAEE